MSTDVQDLAGRLLKTSLENLSVIERRVLERMAEGRHVSRHTNREFDESLTFGQRLADRVAAFGGSWPFIMIFGAVLAGWIVLNTILLAGGRKPFDPFPYILLNLVLSMLAAIQAPVIMMSQNRQSAKDRLDAAHDYEVNLKAELEIARLLEKVDEIRERKWEELIAIQNQQITMLSALLKNLRMPGGMGDEAGRA
jgi:uncharacterized membrane protein